MLISDCRKKLNFRNQVTMRVSMPASAKPGNEISGECTEFFYLDAEGNKQDADLYADMLDNPEADALCAKRAHARAIANGSSKEDADMLFGTHH
jgi:hypothetical protein